MIPKLGIIVNGVIRNPNYSVYHSQSPLPVSHVRFKITDNAVSEQSKAAGYTSGVKYHAVTEGDVFTSQDYATVLINLLCN